MHPFQNKLSENDSIAPQTETEEELFHDYLKARLQQGLEALNVAREALAAQPDDFNRTLQVVHRVQELRDIRAELDAQRASVNAARTTAGLPVATDSPTTLEQPSPTSAFRSVQTEQASRVMAALTRQPSTCPACQAMLPADATACACGYRIAVDASAQRKGINRLFSS